MSALCVELVLCCEQPQFTHQLSQLWSGFAEGEALHGVPRLPYKTAKCTQVVIIIIDE